MVKTVSRIDLLRKSIGQARSAGKSIGFVPTMGFLHDGHYSLIDRARRDNGLVVVSIFVNPMQFGPSEDLAAYPRNLPGDSSGCMKHGTDLLFLPQEDAVYPKGFSTSVEVSGISETLCGKSRPGHFRGVATVVLKLFNLVQPDRAYFGLKDFQQFLVISRMVRDLDLNLEVIGCPTVREPDGLARSSRNVYLTPEQRRESCRISKALFQARDDVKKGEAQAINIKAMIEKHITLIPDSRIDYISICDADSLEELEKIDRRAVVLVACHVGKARLIDNILLNP
ncbi:MAG: pantoate--beta-alanine ligase [Candidatus Wallbacteria bacterium]|nr:pantoate--beta-alanine ligase [Candidatus Wallbacteria bacterium]